MDKAETYQRIRDAFAAALAAGKKPPLYRKLAKQYSVGNSKIRELRDEVLRADMATTASLLVELETLMRCEVERQFAARLEDISTRSSALSAKLASSKACEADIEGDIQAARQQNNALEEQLAKGNQAKEQNRARAIQLLKVAKRATESARIPPEELRTVVAYLQELEASLPAAKDGQP